MVLSAFTWNYKYDDEYALARLFKIELDHGASRGLSISDIRTFEVKNEVIIQLKWVKEPRRIQQAIRVLPWIPFDDIQERLTIEKSQLASGEFVTDAGLITVSNSRMVAAYILTESKEADADDKQREPETAKQNPDYAEKSNGGAEQATQPGHRKTNVRGDEVNDNALPNDLRKNPRKSSRTHARRSKGRHNVSALERSSDPQEGREGRTEDVSNTTDRQPDAPTTETLNDKERK